LAQVEGKGSETAARRRYRVVFPLTFGDEGIDGLQYGATRKP